MKKYLLFYKYDHVILLLKQAIEHAKHNISVKFMSHDHHYDHVHNYVHTNNKNIAHFVYYYWFIYDSRGNWWLYYK